MCCCLHLLQERHTTVMLEHLGFSFTWILLCFLVHYCFLCNLILPFSWAWLSKNSSILLISVCRRIGYFQGLCGSQWYEVRRASNNCHSSCSKCILLGSSSPPWFLYWKFNINSMHCMVMGTDIEAPHFREVMEIHNLARSLSMQRHFLRSLQKS